MPLWPRLLVTTFAMLLASLIAGLIWQGIFDVGIPGYLGGIVGGLAALPVWEILRRPRSKQP